MWIDRLYSLWRPRLFAREAEEAHGEVLEAAAEWPGLARGLAGALVGPARGGPVRIGPLELAGPVGLAAGLDKDGEALALWPALGLGWVELGTVTPRPQEGNPRPRLFRLPDERGIINRMGFNNGGAGALAARLKRAREEGWRSVPMGANIGRNKDTPNDRAEEDYLACVALLAGEADWFTVNVSSPNTPDLRALQAPDRLARLLGAVVGAAATRPVLFKLAPEIDTLAESVEVAIEAGCAGIIATNTTTSRPGSTGRLGEAGGLSGAPLWPLARQRLGEVLAAVRGRLPVIGVGGISSPAQALELLDQGCAAIQLYTGLIYEGPGLPWRIGQAIEARRAP